MTPTTQNVAQHAEHPHRADQVITCTAGRQTSVNDRYAQASIEGWARGSVQYRERA